MLSIERLKVHGLEPLGFQLGAGDCLVVRGPSGAGKSLLLRAIADLDACDGRVSLDGVERGAMQACDWRRKVRYQAAESGWWVADVADHFHDVDWARGMASKLGLPGDVVSRQVARLSSGEKQRLAFLRAIEDHPPVLLLDEPTSALDAGSEAAVETQIAELLAAGAILVLVTHKPAQDARFATRRLTIEHGQARLEAA
jgi:phosphate-transporting ATPase